MNESINRLKPERFWHYFGEILQIPRPSKKEKQIADYVEQFGKTHHLETVRDQAGNILIRKAASPGKENSPGVILQGHLDMVCEKNSDTVHDFDHDPIQVYIEGEWLKAKGTTLGADNGVALAAMLAILEDKSIVHGPLECLFTVDEETGLTGAFALQPGFLKGKILLNLDSEDDGEFFMGCAGGRDTVISIQFKKEPVPSGYTAFKVKVTGLLGGHSGDDIHKNRGNANKILNRLLWISAKKYGLRLASFDGGNLRNAIAREAVSIVIVPDKHAAAFTEEVKKYHGIARHEFRITETNLKVDVEKTDAPSFIIDEKTQSDLLNSLYACPHGVIAFAQDVPGFVETSTNLASVKMADDMIKIATSQRSSVESAKEDISAMVAAVFSMVGAKIEPSDGYPGWTPNPNSKILALSAATYEDLFIQKPVIRAIHAGLECGLIGDKYPGMDMVSFGPTIRNPHSPDERLLISTVEKFWKLTVEVLRRIAKIY